MRWRSGDWLDHSRTLMCFFLRLSFVALSMCFGSLSCWNTHPRPISKPWSWRYTAPSIVPLMQCSCPVLLAEKHPQSIMFPPPCLGMCSWGHRQHSSWVDAKELDFGLIWPQHFHPVLLWILGSSDVLYMCFHEQGELAVLHDLVCYQSFSWWLWFQLSWDHWQDPPV